MKGDGKDEMGRAENETYKQEMVGNSGSRKQMIEFAKLDRCSRRFGRTDFRSDDPIEWKPSEGGRKMKKKQRERQRRGESAWRDTIDRSDHNHFEDRDDDDEQSDEDDSGDGFC